MNKLISGKTFTEAYIKLIEELMSLGVTKAPRGLAISHIQNCLFSVSEPGDVFEHPERPFQTQYLNRELALYLSGCRTAEAFGEASKFWLKLANPDGTINSNYGYRIFYKPLIPCFPSTCRCQWDFAKQQLLADSETRQAVIFVSGEDIQFDKNKDFICTLNYIFNIEDNKLHITVQRRSQDIHFGLPYDYCFEYLLLKKMHNELKEKYPDLQMGSFNMLANNIHVYERNFELYKKILTWKEMTEAVSIEKIVSPENMAKLAEL